MRSITLAVIISGFISYAAISGVPPTDGIHAVALAVPAMYADPDDEEDEDRVRVRVRFK